MRHDISHLYLKGYIMKMTKIGAVLLSAALLTGCSAGDTPTSGDISSIFGDDPTADKPASMIEMSSQQLVSSIRIGWNLGNSLDVCLADGETTADGAEIDETYGGNPYATRELFASLVDEGVNAVRIPVTWRDHIDNDNNISEEWLNRVQQVVDFAYNCGMYVIINMQQDSAWINNAVSKHDITFKRYTRLWGQIAERFRDYNERLLFESMSEVAFDNIPAEKAYETLNSLNSAFVDTIRSSGGNNPERHLVVAGYASDIEQTCDRKFVMPNDPAGKRILSVHYYTPWQFCKTNIQSTWGTAEEQREMERLVDMLKTNFADKGVPVIISEYAASGDDLDSEVFFCEKLVKMCDDYDIGTFMWDSGGQVDRETYKWFYHEMESALQRATRGLSYTPAKGAYHEFATYPSEKST